MIKFIFVCHGNICRSPAAEFVFNKLIKDLKLESKFECYSRALTTEEIGNDIYPPMKIALNNANIPYHSHAATLLHDLDVEYADYIVYMDNENKWLIDNDFNIPNSKQICLAKYINKKEIPDPWYHRNFDDSLAEIANAVKELIKDFI